MNSPAVDDSGPLEGRHTRAVLNEARGTVRAEARWPMVTAVLAGLALSLVRPRAVQVLPPGVVQGAVVVLLGILIMRDPGRIDRRSSGLRVLSLVLVGLMAIDALAATVHLIRLLIEGSTTTSSASTLLAAGGTVWASNLIVFSLLYWEVDSGGAAARAHAAARHPDFAFPQQMSPEIAPPGWRPQFVDYLYLALTCSTAFSPTDVMPLTPRAKMTMGCQSLISLAVVGLVVARAVNVLG
jgi:uncharacterized membrane protein